MFETRIRLGVLVTLVGLVAGLAVVAAGVMAGVLGSRLVVVLGIALGSVLLAALERWQARPVDTTLAVTPQSVHHGDRTVTLVFGLVLGTLMGLGGILALGYELGLMGVPVGWLMGGLLVGNGGSAWGRFTIVRGWLALRGRLPWPLLSFLDDAHRLGVLRQAGAIYQFRHALLQDHLAATSRASGTHGVRPP